MKLLFISSGTLPIPAVQGGAVENLTEMLINHNERSKKFDITFYSIYDKLAYEKSLLYKKCKFKFIDGDGFYYKTSKIVRFIINKIPGIYIGNAFINEVKKDLKKDLKKDYDLVVVENNPMFALILRNIFNDKLILHLHNDFLNINIKKADEVARSFKEIWVLSNYIKHRVNNIGVNTEVKTLYNGIDTSKFKKELYLSQRKELREQYGIKVDEIVIVFAGRLVKEKGICELLQAFVKIPKKYKVKLLIIGSAFFNVKSSNTYVEKLKKIASEDEERIVFTGFVDYKNMPLVYSIGDIGIVPSIWEEPFGLTVIEQMASGLPMIVSDAGGIPEIIDDKSAIIVKRGHKYIENLKNSIIKLVEDSNYREEMSNNAMERAKIFDTKIYCERFEELVEGAKKIR